MTLREVLEADWTVDRLYITVRTSDLHFVTEYIIGPDLKMPKGYRWKCETKAGNVYEEGKNLKMIYINKIIQFKDDEFEDYWFSVKGETQAELSKEYMEMCMVAVTYVVYSRKENKIGVRRQFPFNYDVIIPTNHALAELLVSLANDVDNKS